MARVRWVLLDDGGAELRSTQDFESRAEAEQWLAGTWQSLADEGAATVSLRDDSGELYEMSLAEE